ncbi:hypothetical protein AAFF_G00067310 [Aldrovandia affinis]|uniref:Integrase catalytic domain-containing protein n=1 Tax=Aldrovandia affinis TaxID=143900 RepID=A0AAD7WZ02_9TELE|nr:hypothetical protein AAFF_G00067310 [Aldrovandia affinis]
MQGFPDDGDGIPLHNVVQRNRRVYMAKTRQVVGEQAEADGESDESTGDERGNRKHDEGLMRDAARCYHYGSTQSAHQADGSSLLKVLGEIRTHFQRDGHNLYFEGLVVEDLDSDILAGIPFMEKNYVSIRPAKHQICLGDDVYRYGTYHTSTDRHAVRRAHVLRAPAKSTVWPGDYIELDLPPDLCGVDGELAVEPHIDALRDQAGTHQWPAPTLLRGVSGKIRVPNLTNVPQLVQKSHQLCRVRATYVPPISDATVLADPPRPVSTTRSSLSSDLVALDPDDIMPSDVKDKFRALHREFDEVFDPQFKGYNGAVGPFQAKVNMGPVQPLNARAGSHSTPGVSYKNFRHSLTCWRMSVFKKPEDVDVSVEYVNPSFLIKKPGGGFRLVTAFADVGRYSKPQPSLMPDVDSTLRLIAQDSWKYCGVVTPFKGVRVYVRSAMGMPGSETALEELTCRVFGELLEQGHVAKVADDLYCGANTLEDLLAVWRRVLSALQRCGLNLSATKTTVAPVQTSILGWVWRQGTIQASPHRVSALAACPPPKTVTGLRSFIGAYKVLARVLKDCATMLAPFDDVVAGRDSKDVIHWSDELLCAFSRFQVLIRHVAGAAILPSDFASRNAPPECESPTCQGRPDGLLTSLHIKLDHPTATQLKAVVQRYFYALDMDAAVQRVTNGCHRCASLKKAPVFMSDQSTCDPPEVVGSTFAADVFRRDRQFILVVRECVTSFTLSSLIEDERRETLRDALLRLCLGLCPLDGPFAVIRTDPAPGFAALAGDEVLAKHRLVVEVGNAKNINKNPVAEKAVQELQDSDPLRDCHASGGGAVPPSGPGGPRTDLCMPG